MAKKISVKLMKSFINTKPRQRDCLRGLGLKKIGDERVLDNIPEIRGMIKKVIHLIKWTEQ